MPLGVHVDPRARCGTWRPQGIGGVWWVLVVGEGFWMLTDAVLTNVDHMLTIITTIIIKMT